MGALLAGWAVNVTDKPGETCGILVVEDDQAIRRLVTMVLKREGYHVEVAVDGVEAVLKLGVCDFDVIVLDLMMPNLDGFTFLETMSIHDPERIKKIIVTSAASPAVILERMKGITFDLLPKPFEIADLLERVRICIANQKANAGAQSPSS